MRITGAIQLKGYQPHRAVERDSPAATTARPAGMWVRHTPRFLWIAAAVVTLAVPAFAHHSFAMFDYNKEITITGAVKELQWTNPHIHLLVNAPDAKGVMAEFDIEGGTPGNLRRQGWSRDVVKPGDKISVVIRPLKNGDNGGQLISAKKGDGTPIGGQAGGGE